jgi:hypothetical protein
MSASPNNPYTIVFLAWSSMLTQLYAFADGTGEPADPYRIATPAQLISIGSDPNLLDKHFVLVNDIDLDPNLPGGQVFTRAVMAPDMELVEDFQGMAFTGDFDGNGHTVRNLTIRNDADRLDKGDYLGLFGKLGRQAIVKDLGIEAARVGERNGECYGVLAGWNEGRIVRCHVEGRVSGGASIGGLVGRNQGEIFDCHATSDFVGGYSEIGGLVGGNYAGAQVVKCHATCRVFLIRSMAGGLIGSNWGCIINSYATGEVIEEHSTNDAGGLVGMNLSPGVITNCYATGNVLTWDQKVSAHSLGGLVGNMLGGSVNNCYATGSVNGGSTGGSLGALAGTTNLGCISNSYAIGRVSAGENSKRVGGLIGDATSTLVKASFWDIETSGWSQSGGGTGLTTVQMQDINTYMTAGWDFVSERDSGTADVWLMPQGGGYPALTLGSDAYEPPGLAGRGTADDPYRIGTPEDLGAVWRHDPSACYELAADIDLSSITWSAAPIGCFSGTLDGAGFVVSNLTIRGLRQLGLFGSLGTRAVVANLGIEDANVIGEDEAEALGILAAYNEGHIVNCYATGQLSVGNRSRRLGGLVGINGAHPLGTGEIAGCYAILSISAGGTSGLIGGLVGTSYKGTLTNCYAAGHISAGDNSIDLGSLVGSQTADGNTTACYFLAPVEGEGPPNNGFGVPLADAQMRLRSSFIGWDFENTWMICEGKDYPRLQWENVQCKE